MIAEDLLEEVHKCNKCGACLSSCQVFKQLNYESGSPRGKVQLIKKILAGKLEPSENFNKILFTCLLCESCTVTCPSGLKIDRLMKAMRSELVKKYGQNWQKQGAFKLLANNKLLSLSMFFGRTLEKPLRSFMAKDATVGTLKISQLPSLNKIPLRDQFPEVIRSNNGSNGRVLYFTGCATNYMYENVGQAVIKILNRLGVEVSIPKDQMCCSLPIFLSGARDQAIKNIKNNIVMFKREDVDAIIVDCATCGAALKNDYVHILEEMGEDAGPARSMAASVKDISEYLQGFDLKEIFKPINVRVTYHDPCHLLRSQGVKNEPRELLKQIPGLDFVEMVGADTCCGGGGSFQLQHPNISSEITSRKITSIMNTEASIVASGCSGCRLQISGNLKVETVQVVHPVELLAKALK
ncbi:MAG: (Fe-S)-binding protein [Desulfuromonadaceae bacterium]|nr:(Fe-S)-binding protein [Desulfuromonadaceae bacterium]